MNDDEAPAARRNWKHFTLSNIYTPLDFSDRAAQTFGAAFGTAVLPAMVIALFRIAMMMEFVSATCVDNHCTFRFNRLRQSACVTGIPQHLLTKRTYLLRVV